MGYLFYAGAKLKPDARTIRSCRSWTSGEALSPQSQVPDLNNGKALRDKYLLLPEKEFLCLLTKYGKELTADELRQPC